MLAEDFDGEFKEGIICNCWPFYTTAFTYSLLSPFLSASSLASGDSTKYFLSFRAGSGDLSPLLCGLSSSFDLTGELLLSVTLSPGSSDFSLAAWLPCPSPVFFLAAALRSFYRLILEWRRVYWWKVPETFLVLGSSLLKSWWSRRSSRWVISSSRSYWCLFGLV